MNYSKYLKDLKIAKDAYDDVYEKVPKPTITKWTLFKRFKQRRYNREIKSKLYDLGKIFLKNNKEIIFALYLDQQKLQGKGIIPIAADIYNVTHIIDVNNYQNNYVSNVPFKHSYFRTTPRNTLTYFYLAYTKCLDSIDMFFTENIISAPIAAYAYDLIEDKTKLFNMLTSYGLIIEIPHPSIIYAIMHPNHKTLVDDTHKFAKSEMCQEWKNKYYREKEQAELNSVKRKYGPPEYE